MHRLHSNPKGWHTLIHVYSETLLCCYVESTIQANASRGNLYICRLEKLQLQTSLSQTDTILNKCGRCNIWLLSTLNFYSVPRFFSMVFQLDVKITQLTAVERIPARALKGGCRTNVNHLAGDSYTRKEREKLSIQVFWKIKTSTYGKLLQTFATK